jgi:hypothetical protein
MVDKTRYKSPKKCYRSRLVVRSMRLVLAKPGAGRRYHVINNVRGAYSCFLRIPPFPNWILIYIFHDLFARTRFPRLAHFLIDPDLSLIFACKLAKPASSNQIRLFLWIQYPQTAFFSWLAQVWCFLKSKVFSTAG